MAYIVYSAAVLFVCCVHVSGDICDIDPSTPIFQVFSDEFQDIIGDNPELELLKESVNESIEFHEGPVYFSDDQDGYLLYTTQPPADYSDPNTGPQITIRRYDIATNVISTFRDESLANMPNGQTRDPQGRLLTCEQGFRTTPARISRTNISTGAVETIADSYYGRLFNSMNDVVVKSDGTIWFTDPSYGYQQGFKPKPEIGDFVYRFDPDGPDPKLTVVSDDFERPNGLAFSPDESYLYVSDSGAIQGSGEYRTDLPHHIRRFDVLEGRYLRNTQLFAVSAECVNKTVGQQPGIPDGVKVDICGNVYVGAGDGVQVFNPDGLLIGKIFLGRGAPNLVFGGKLGNELYIMADIALYRVQLNIQGAEFADTNAEGDTSVILISKDECPTSSASVNGAFLHFTYLFAIFSVVTSL
ncbi:gluconolactonase-like [Ptychodera flava]|uniref:gluconolactonase-like n=1 Tax=Ptychodera flava TaxID=63121 RepID=UPI00396A9323